MTVAPLYKPYKNVEPTGVKRTFGLWDAGHTVEYCHAYEEVAPSKVFARRVPYVYQHM